MKSKVLLKLGLCLCVLLTMTHVAFAQDATQPVLVSALTPTSVTIATLAFVVAFTVNAFNSGKFLGLTTVPQTWLPYMGIAIPFLSEFWTSLSSAGSINPTSLFNAVQMSLFALLTYAGGAKTHQVMSDHMDAPAIAKAKDAAVLLLVLGGLSGLVMTQTGCPQASGAVAPAADCGIAIIEDAVAGLDVPEIVAKEGIRCGVDAAAVVKALTESTDVRLQGTKALKTARQMRAAQDGGAS